MKLVFTSLALIFLSSINQGFTQQGNPNKDTIIKYYSTLARSENDEDKRLLESLLYKRIKSNTEKDLRVAKRFFYWLQKPQVGDSLSKVAIKRYPLGEESRDKEVDQIYNEKDAIKKEQFYLKWIAKFPPSKKWEDAIPYDYAAHAVSQSFFDVGNTKKGMLYAKKLQSPIWTPEGISGLAESRLKNADIASAAELAKMGLEKARKYLTAPTDTSAGAIGFVKTAFVNHNYILAQVSYQQKKYDQALRYVKVAYDSSQMESTKISVTYSDILAAEGKKKEAFELLSKIIEGGEMGSEIQSKFKKLYIDVNGSESGYKEFIAAMNKRLVEKVAEDLAGQMINRPAPNFTLTDVNGQSVSLSELKGKTVLLDFWATWCVPCKKSFPAMKKAMERYRDDSSVSFLFIHTWEKEENATASAKKFITDNNYPFRVLMDLKDSKSGLNKVVTDYGVDGIPAKFLIDKNGNIRFKFIGGAPSEDVAIEEVITMIEMTKKG